MTVYGLVSSSLPFPAIDSFLQFESLALAKTNSKPDNSSRMRNSLARMQVAFEVRMGWIEMAVRSIGSFEGRLKKIYAEVFDLASGTVSKDQKAFAAEYNRRAGRRVVAVVRGKVVLRDRDDLPSVTVFDPPTARDWLAACIGPAFEVCDVAPRAPASPNTVAELAKAITGRQTAVLEYQSRSGVASGPRMISPHSVVEVAGRQHVRAYDHDQGRWADFVLSRILRCVAQEGSETRYVAQSEDRDWNDIAEIEVATKVMPPPIGVVIEYGLPPSGKTTTHVRKALVQYVLDEHEASFDPPISKRICLK